MRVDFCDLDGMTVADLIEYLRDFDDDAVVSLREEMVRGGFGGPAVEDTYLEIGEE